MLDADEWRTLDRLTNLLVLAIDGLDAHARDFVIERARDVLPLTTLVWDLRAALGQFERRVARATYPVPLRPAELADRDRQPG